MVPRVGLAHSRVLHQAHCTRPHHGSPHVRSPILVNAARSAPAAPSTSHPHSSGGSGPGTAVVQPVPHRLGCGAGRPGRSRSGPGGTHRCRIGALVVTARRRPGRSDQPGLGTAGRSRRAARRFGARPDRTRRPRRPSGRLNSSRSVATRTGDCSVTTGTGADLTNAGGRSLVVDALMLYLGLPTAAEPRTPAHLVCSVWLDRLLAATVLEPGRVTTWTAAIRHHPLSSGGTTAPELAAITQDLGAMGWDPMRLAVAAGSTDWVDLDPVGAAWMDRGAFARRLLDRYPDLDDQCRVLSAVMPTRLAHTVRHAVSASLTHRR